MSDKLIEMSIHGEPQEVPTRQVVFRLMPHPVDGHNEILLVMKDSGSPEPEEWWDVLGFKVANGAMRVRSYNDLQDTVIEDEHLADVLVTF